MVIGASGGSKIISAMAKPIIRVSHVQTLGVVNVALYAVFNNVPLLQRRTIMSNACVAYGCPSRI